MHVFTHANIYIYIITHAHQIYIYIYIITHAHQTNICVCVRERERERGNIALSQFPVLSKVKMTKSKNKATRQTQRHMVTAQPHC